MTSRARGGWSAASPAPGRGTVREPRRRRVTAVAVTSATAVVAAGGTALAFAATGPAPGGAGSTEGSGPAAALVFELADGSQVAGSDVFTAEGAQVDVLGTNRSGVAVDVSDPDLLLPRLTLPPGCPPGSFVVAGAEAAVDSVLAPGEADLVGSFQLAFDADAAAGSDTCFGRDITFSWPGPDPHAAQPG